MRMLASADPSEDYCRVQVAEFGVPRGEPRLCAMEGMAWLLLCPCAFFVLLFFAATVILWFQTKPGSR
ncbi:hypothetical protein HCA58_22620 [Micromonospora sp. HNM0581]|uniref:hypothetical protein n=1 Tax=Micromonospora sp. HNM0581 TaxID=2716341 RepID=UPI00146DE585|nr:hypothetical protein [Micromonospora sp. HNM0581]NLU81087.1 hypothetical protein [Micromonospora sp. HNM0581]